MSFPLRVYKTLNFLGILSYYISCPQQLKLIDLLVTDVYTKIVVFHRLSSPSSTSAVLRINTEALSVQIHFI